MRRTTSFGGAEIAILDLLKAIDYETNIVLLASSGDVFSTLLTDLKLPVTSLPLTARFTGGFVRMFISWIRYLNRLRPDAIILAEGGFRDFPLCTALAAFVIARGNLWMMEFHPAPQPTTKHSRTRFTFIPRLSPLKRPRAWLTKGILSASQGVKDRLVNGYGYAPEKIRVVYTGVDTKRFSPVSQDSRKGLRRQLQIPDEAVVVVSAARLHRIKRLDRLIQAFSALSLEYKDLWLLLTGDGPLRDELKRLAQSVNNREHIRFLGHVKDVCAILRASDIYVLPSDEEGFGIALAEAMACELVCVATKTVGPSEIIEDGLNGFLTDLTYDGVLKGLDQALRLGHKERRAIGERARQTVVDNFRVEETTAKSLAFMEINPAGAVR
ncbi:MAG TPA: glycosyltransferase [Candidatus Binataceae bacterium]|nr:glycosyltransferase [Candidatus Binataceae bacterium]